MRQIKSVLILFLSLSGFFSFNLKAQEEIWSLERCVQYALENNLTIKQFELNARMSENTFAQSKFDLAPNLNAGASHSYSFGRALDQTTYEFTDHETVQSNNFSLKKMFALENTVEKQVVVSTDFIDRDVIGIAGSYELSLITVLIVRGGVLLGTRNFAFSETMSTQTEII